MGRNRGGDSRQRTEEEELSKAETTKGVGRGADEEEHGVC